MSAPTPPVKPGITQQPNIDQLYAQICANIRATDDISFKLLGFVPLLSGSAILVMLLKGGGLPAVAVVLLCLAGIALTIGLYCWERRNIKTCMLFRDAASSLEAAWPADLIRPYSILGSDEPPAKYASSLGKRQSEGIIYAVSVFVWLIPIVN